MVLTPSQQPVDLKGQPSPLLLPINQATSSRSPPIAPTSPTHATHPPPLRKASTSSFSKLSELKLDPDAEDEPEGNGVEGVRHVELSVNAGEWRHPVFKTKVLSILRKLRVPLWTSSVLTPSSIHLQKVSGALTNAVFFVSFNPRPEPTSPSMSPLLTPTMPPYDPDHPPPLTPDQYPPTLLLRVYGPSSGALISRTDELRILHVLSTVYGFGPKVYGTFLNGRVEQFFPSCALTAAELRDRVTSRCIARRMRELHSVDLRLLGYEQGRETEPTVWRCLGEWASLAAKVLNTLGSKGGRWEMWVERFGLRKVKEEVEVYSEWVEHNADKGKGVVFAHNDTQYGNLLHLDVKLPQNVPAHHQYIVIDFEYAAPNPRGYDIANHFHEWRANYHHPTLSHSLQPHFPYPDRAQRENFYRAYLSVEVDGRNGEEIMRNRKDIPIEKVEALEREVRIWSPACSVFWSLWGIVQAEEQVAGLMTGKTGTVEFDYLSYAMERLEMFRKEARELGVPLPNPQ